MVQVPASLLKCMEQERGLMDGDEAWRSLCSRVVGFGSR